MDKQIEAKTYWGFSKLLRDLASACDRQFKELFKARDDDKKEMLDLIISLGEEIASSKQRIAQMEKRLEASESKVKALEYGRGRNIHDY